MVITLEVPEGTTPEKAILIVADSAVPMMVSKWEDVNLDRQLLPEFYNACDRAYHFKVDSYGGLTVDEESSAREIRERFQDCSLLSLTELLVLISQTNPTDSQLLFDTLKKQGVVCPTSQFQDGGVAGLGIRNGTLRIFWIHPELTRGLAYLRRS